MRIIHTIAPAAPQQAAPKVPRDRLIRMPEVENLTGLRKSAIYSLLGAKRFPRPVRLSGRCVAWPESAVLQWVQDRIAESNHEGDVK
ncbi:MAG: AlpA family transcriptional regulator [Comamonadaceae bacterium]|nr:AlpA family transcriptional regulator [Comamonadaceae bacterium]